MIKINSIKINSIGDKVNFNVETTIGNRFVKLLTWDEDSYKDYSMAVDISSFLSKVSNIENMEIPLLDLQQPEFKGLIFFEFTTNENSNNTAIGFIANLTKYHNCLTNKLLAIDICKNKLVFKREKKDTWEDCTSTSTTDTCCDDCDDAKTKCNEIIDDCGNNIFYLNSLMPAIYRALLCNEYSISVKLLKRIKEMAIDCCTFREEDSFYISTYIVNDKMGVCVQKKQS